MTFFFRRTLLLFLLGTAAAVAQPHRGDRSRVEQARIAFITSRLELTPAQAERFWPIYHALSDERRGHLRQMRRLRQQIARPENTPPDEIKKQLYELAALRRQEVALEETYLTRLLAVLSPQQVAQFYRAEREFVRRVMRELDRAPTDDGDE